MVNASRMVNGIGNMASCTYDNPDTFSRECWQDGRLLCSYSAKILQSKGFEGSAQFFFGANIGPWRTGQMIGDRDAVVHTNHGG